MQYGGVVVPSQNLESCIPPKFKMAKGVNLESCIPPKFNMTKGANLESCILPKFKMAKGVRPADLKKHTDIWD
ncbi:hypothetical protein T484DRAFT_1813782, partial [Baffinella frigidus]